MRSFRNRDLREGRMRSTTPMRDGVKVFVERVADVAFVFVGARHAAVWVRAHSAAGTL